MINLVLVASDYRIKDDFKSAVESTFNGLVVNRDFKSRKVNLVDEVNQLVANKTNGMIKKALDGPIDANTRLIVLNAFSFEGDWVHPFPKSLIVQRPFFGIDLIKSSTLSSTLSTLPSIPFSNLSSSSHSTNSLHTKSFSLSSLIPSSFKNGTTDRVPFMTLSLRTNYAEIEEKDMKIVQLDYVGDVSMFILLPNQKDSLLRLVRNLTVQEIDSYIGGRLTQSDIDIEIPKFTFEVQYDLMERLEDLRLSISRADYTGIAERFESVEGTKVDNSDGNDSIGSDGHGVGSDSEGVENGSSKHNKNKSKNNSKDSNNNNNVKRDSGSRRRIGGGGGGFGIGGVDGGDGDSRSSQISNSSSNSNRSSSGNGGGNKKKLLRALVRDQDHLSLTSAIHKSIIKVDEKGTKAAAFTGFGFHPLSTISGQAQFIADHPFLFIIRDKSKGVNIFTGAVNKLTG